MTSSEKMAQPMFLVEDFLFCYHISLIIDDSLNAITESSITPDSHQERELNLAPSFWQW